MSLRLNPLNPTHKDRETLERINREAFPPNEYMPADEMFDFAAHTGAEVLGIYDDETFVGFFFFVKNDRCGYIFFFAIDQTERSKGYGARALQLLSDAYPALQIILDFEELDEAAENFDQRVRRKKFYLHNGFSETGHYTLLRGARFEVVCNRGELLTEPFQKLITVIHLRCPYFPDILL